MTRGHSRVATVPAIKCRNIPCSKLTRNRDGICDDCRKPGVKITLACPMRTVCGKRTPKAYQKCWEECGFVKDVCRLRDGYRNAKEYANDLIGEEII